MLKVLSTKLLGQNLIDSARDMDMILTCVEFIKTKGQDFDIPTAKYDAIVFTSSNGVKGFFEKENASNRLGIKIFAQSGKTKNELAKHNIEPMAVAGDAEALAEVIIAFGNISSVLHICGNLKLDTLGQKLIVYETTLSGTKITEDYDVVMFYSPSGVESFLSENKLNRDTLYCCIGDTTAAKLRKADGNATIIVSSAPTAEAMLFTIKNFEIKS
jgi:uroporphyrinogen-III synthase